MSASPWPTEVVVHKGGGGLEIAFDTGERYEIPASLLRVMTPSAAERGHGGPSLEPLALDKAGVAIVSASPIGRYALRIAFDDGHDSGLYTWVALHRIGRDRAELEAAHARMLAR